MPQFLAQARFIANGEAKDNYTKIAILPIFKTSSKHTANIYKYISHFRDMKVVYCKLDSFKKFMNIENRYKTVSDIKRRVISPAIKELKEKADVWFDIAERVMDGRKFVGWKFNIYTKEPKKTKKAAKKEEAKPLAKLNNAELSLKKQELIRELEEVKSQEKQISYEALVKIYKNNLSLRDDQAEKVAYMAMTNSNFKFFLEKLAKSIDSNKKIRNVGAVAVSEINKQDFDIKL